ncbi:lactonase family protein [Photobacterium sanctipauli]|uniref:Lactonase family protein n=1 Tax=Photobacterium sanctipauli TaxID=1342794 RepID=A0A2T3NX31_9GAMM|nr:lactonase family protein [Photobacterium sanctipauli]PSW20772.1 lactonase family protein [Photobacterium sanctipauli]
MTANSHLHFYVGTYTDAPSNSSGIAHITLNPETGELTRLDDAITLRNPSYLAATKQGVYAFSEVAREEGAALNFISSATSQALPIAGDYPCHLDIKAPYLAVANYGSGNVSVYQLDGNGGPLDAIGELYVEGSGPNKDRQLSPHAHQVTFLKSSNHLAIVDLGTDSVHFFGYSSDADKPAFALDQSIAMPAGSGPRHLVFNQSETTAYVVCELSETLVVLTNSKTGWQVTHQCDLLAETPNGEAASAIRLSTDEKYLYVSCRAQNKISHFNVSGEVPRRLAAYDCGGAFPRDFIISADGKWLLTANQHSNNIASFHRNSETGELAPTGYQCNVDAPVCLVEIAK